MNYKKIDLENFDFSQFRTEAIEQLKAGQSLTGKDGILTPLSKKFLKQLWKERWILIYQNVNWIIFQIGVMANYQKQ